MTTPEIRLTAIESIETAIAHLGDALVELDRMPAQDKTATIGLVAHALNNHLSVAEATLDLLSGALSDHPNPEVATWLLGLRHLGAMMQHTISRLVHASTPADFLLKPEHVDLAKLMTRACDYYRPTAERTQLEIICRAVGTVPTAWADRVAVAVVADNILSNAVKFSPEGSAVLVQIQPGPGGIVCSVRDQGPGLTPTELSRLFQRVVRSGPPAAGHQPRQGYGFAIAMELIDRMGGRMWYENGPGKGSVFFFSLPYAPVTTSET